MSGDGASAPSGPTAPEVTLNTSVGPITVELYYKHAPKTCQNFIELARRGYYAFDPPAAPGLPAK